MLVLDYSGIMHDDVLVKTGLVRKIRRSSHLILCYESLIDICDHLTLYKK